MNDPTKISAHPPPEEKGKSSKIETSKGEQLFDWLAYGGFAGAVTFALGLPFGYWARYTKGGEAIHKWAISHSKQVGLSAQVTEDIVMNTALMQGGNAMILPIKIMEDHKPQLVAKLNDMLGDKSGDCSVQDEPKQTWGTLFTSRILCGWLPVFVGLRTAAVLGGPEAFNNFEKSFSKNVICEPLGKPTHINGVETFTFKMGRIAAIDVFATAAAASLLYIGTRIFARGNKEKWKGAAALEEPDQAIENLDAVTTAMIAPAPAGNKHATAPKPLLERAKPAGSYSELACREPAAQALQA